MDISLDKYSISELENNISSKKICLIANGESILNYKLGEIIDQFPNVGRINNYSLDGFKKNIGSKTDIWFNGANQNLKKRNKTPAHIVVLIPASILKEKGHNIHIRVERRLGISKSDYEMPSYSDMERYEKLCGVIRPTTGTSSIIWALENFQEIFIHGFDFFISSKAHYNDTAIVSWLIQKGIMKKGHKHDMGAEKNYIESLIQSGNIRQLTELL
ncbi:MAG: hypothetical protein HN729_06090 [Candidatus Marinimicrobia bacterium]|jgi:hypothetical protein|nr:hypothetical protein [Candidatus Neomarinimicrobiota bacterium]MBT3633914.1 hypothetical protein [Candidatus Neomarinimicrobiota bacterium]MBT3682836.1 hypothetical protein [Candidatus Neomarinimicrobiota bacterium]MBT3759977.1 hypothetical protein [Candidatus Neomarinimicrobiota bacterium]MBT3896071.1 hypothetical protein [Candidatus Neomarinimicrobiota bacterium]